MGRQPAADLDQHYGSLLGERWPTLRAALLCAGPWGIRLNGFTPTQPSPPAGETWEELPAVLHSADAPFPPAGRGPDGLLAWYAMDPASVLAARELGVRPGERVLDACAAPGGKSLVLAESLAGLGEGEHEPSGAAGQLVANERSATRRARLLRVLDDYLPPEWRQQVQVTGHDATRWSQHERDAFDRILLDVPCSSEAHVLADPRALRGWTPARSKQLVRRQYALLASALDVVRVGGTILYSTCSVLPAENDGVVERLLGDRKRQGRVELRPISSPLGEATACGRIVLPDREPGFGPIYMARLERTA